MCFFPHGSSDSNSSTIFLWSPWNFEICFLPWRKQVVKKKHGIEGHIAETSSFGFFHRCIFGILGFWIASSRSATESAAGILPLRGQMKTTAWQNHKKHCHDFNPMAMCLQYYMFSVSKRKPSILMFAVFPPWICNVDRWKVYGLHACRQFWDQSVTDWDLLTPGTGISQWYANIQTMIYIYIYSS